ncbi:MAG: ribosomal methyltransferase KsgA/Dim1 family protein [Bacteroidota bacterium]|jgi:16S rRNA (adenine1518-N6/adenine1519-N6)-dimethyltransferase
MDHVQPKKHLGQHFLRNESICADIAAAITFHGNYTHLLEVGPGMGALTKHLKPLNARLQVVEIDRESVQYLLQTRLLEPNQVLSEDFLRMDLTARFPEPIAVVGNFPYNISSQIVFKVLEHKDRVHELVGMFQKEVAERFATGPGSKEYGVTSVLAQAYYDIEYLFTVHENEFIPPPKVKSGVIRMKRKFNHEVGCTEKKLRLVVKTAFNQRRKTLSNSLKSILPPDIDKTLPVFKQRPEQLSVAEFVALTNLILPD